MKIEVKQVVLLSKSLEPILTSIHSKDLHLFKKEKKKKVYVKYGNRFKHIEDIYQQ